MQKKKPSSWVLRAAEADVLPL